MNKTSFAGIGCGGIIFVLIFVMAVGGFCFDYTLNFIFGKDIHWFGDCIAGLILSEIVLPVAVVCFILDVCGVDYPIVGKTPPAQPPVQQTQPVVHVERV